MLALLPIITPPFVVGLGLILLFGRAGLVNQFLEWAFGVDADALVLRLRHLAGAAVRLHADRLPDHARRRRGHQPDARRGGADAARRPLDDLPTVTLPLMKPGLANAFLVGFIESIADFGNPIVVGGRYGAVDRDLLRHRRRAVRPGPRRVAGPAAAGVRAGRLLPAARRARPPLLHDGHRQGRRRPADAAARRRAPRRARGRGAVARVHARRLRVRASSAASCRSGAATTRRRCATSPAFAFERSGRAGLVWAGTAWNSLFTTLKLAAIAAPLMRRARPADRLAARAHAFAGRARSSSAPAGASRSRAPCSASATSSPSTCRRSS